MSKIEDDVIDTLSQWFIKSYKLSVKDESRKINKIPEGVTKTCEPKTQQEF